MIEASFPKRVSALAAGYALGAFALTCALMGGMELHAQGVAGGISSHNTRAPVDIDAGHEAAEALMQGNLPTAFTVAVTHTAAMTIAGGILALIIYTWLGLEFLSKTWFNLDTVWAVSLILVGVFGICTAVNGH